MLNKKISILSIDPGTKHMGYASFEGTDLVDSGVKTVRQGSERIIIGHIGEIIARMIAEKQPDYIAIEKNNFSQVTQNLRLVRSIMAITYVAKKKGIIVYEFDLRTIRKEICNDGNANKKRVAEALIIYFPELSIYLKSNVKHVLRYNFNMFDAVAVGLTFVKCHINNALPIRQKSMKRS